VTRPAPTLIRQATDDDLDAVCEMVRMQFREEAPYLPVAESKLRGSVELCHSRQGVIVSCDDNGVPVGTLGIVTDAPFWSARVWVIGIWHFVRQANRQEMHMRTMLQAARVTAKQLHAPFRVEVWTSERTKGKLGMFRREFSDASGALFLSRD
jgi:transposase